MILKKNNLHLFHREVLKCKKTLSILCSSLIAAGLTAQATSNIIPSEVKSTFETVRTWIKGDLAPVILGILWVCSCIGYGFNKDSNKAKIAFLAVSIACAGVGLGLKIVEQFIKVGGA